MDSDSIRQYLEVVALGRRPSVDQLEQTLTEATAGGGHVGNPHDVARLRRELTAATVDIGRWAADGDTGQARRVAADHLARIVGNDNTAPATTTDPDMRAVVDSIPRY